MEDALYNKFIQHPDLRALLFSTFGAEIIFEDEEDEFWGDGGASQGANELGKCLVRVRERLREDGY